MRLFPLVAVLSTGLLVAGCGSSAKAHSSVPTHIYRIPSSAMEPALHCARPAPGCQGKAEDLIVAQLSGATGLKRGDIVVFTTPRRAAMDCGEGGTFVKRVIGLGGETVHEDKYGVIYIDGKRLSEPYIPAA